MINRYEGPQFTKGNNLCDLLNVAHAFSKNDLDKVKGKVKHEKRSKEKVKVKETVHEPSPSYTNDYMVTMDHNDKTIVK